MRVPTHSETISETPSDTPSDTPSEPRAERREAPRERAVPALRTRPAVATTVHGISQRISACKSMLHASTAHSGRNSSEFRRVVRGSERASERLRIRLQLRFQSRGSERSRRSAHGPPWPQLSTAFRNACQPASRCSALQPLTLAGILPNSGASFAALKARPAHSGTISANAGLPVRGSERAPRELPAAQTAPTTRDSQMQLPESDAIRAGAHSACCRMSCRPRNVPGGTNRTQGARSEGDCGRGWHRGG